MFIWKCEVYLWQRSTQVLLSNDNIAQNWELANGKSR